MVQKRIFCNCCDCKFKGDGQQLLDKRTVKLHQRNHQNCTDQEECKNPKGKKYTCTCCDCKGKSKLFIDKRTVELHKEHHKNCTDHEGCKRPTSKKTVLYMCTCCDCQGKTWTDKRTPINHQKIHINCTLNMCAVYRRTDEFHNDDTGNLFVYIYIYI